MDTSLVDLAIALPVVLALAGIIAVVLRRLFGPARSLSLPTMTVIGVLGVSVGLLLSAWVGGAARLWVPTTILFSVGASIALSAVVAAAVATARRDGGDIDVAALLRAGESDRVEFKETARWNVRENRKDTRMEVAIAKSIAAFLNSRGGTLVIGAADDGTAIGLDRDMATLRTPDHDRFELWLRDMLSTALGRNAAAQPRIVFASPGEGAPAVCVVVCRPAPKPVFLTQPKDGGSATDLWVRVGNSSRALGVDEAVEYVARHWQPSVKTVVLGRPGS
ncbi:MULTISPECIES: AlbA family DNA-binding domain-containing protein [Microbacterium]|uniref:AlbA family DNA-binding domain-containing protein n=1 Tax=Microbacterium TaxID=33882 RepID=UPI001D16FE2D|nr:ATP-binding protein [Microbacterium testaceum]MCC4248703.1 ATP-binding protein [Microbacterium testaceum]